MRDEHAKEIVKGLRQLDDSRKRGEAYAQAERSRRLNRARPWARLVQVIKKLFQ